MKNQSTFKRKEDIISTDNDDRAFYWCHLINNG